jgi:acetylornithine deacetylase
MKLIELLELLRKMVETPSPSGEEDRIISFISSYLDEKGFDYKIDEGAKNLIIEGTTNFWVATHIDTPPGNYTFRFDGDYAYGTGVCDAKGSVAAILQALEEIPDLNFGIALLSDEEEGGKGSEKFACRYKGKAVVMEPTNLKIALRHYGGIEFKVKVKGRSAHASYPEYGLNAVERAFEMINKIKKLGIPGKIVPMEIKGGDDRYSIPNECYLRFSFTIPTSLKVTKIVETLNPILMEYGNHETGEIYDGFEEEAFQELEEALRLNDLKVEYCEMHSWTDAINLKKAGWKAIVWGPGELPCCHTSQERIKLMDIAIAAKVLVKLNELLK